jgi:hypothetical protein
LPSAAAAGLRVPALPERLVALLRAHQNLLTKIKGKRKNLDRLGERIRVAAGAVAAQLRPLYLELDELDRESHRLFAALLSRKQQARAATRAIKALYQTLQRIELLSRCSPESTTERARPASDSSRTHGGADDEPPSRASDETSASASRPDDGPIGQSVRSLFRKLAAALHPDRAQHEVERELRTEAMKEINRAYQDGDLARLLELERSWVLGGKVTPPGATLDELDLRCATLERTNAGLRAQLDQLTRELKELRRSPQAELLSQLDRSAPGAGMSAVDWMVEQAESQRADLHQLVAFMTSFIDGEIDLEELLEGPEFLQEERRR